MKHNHPKTSHKILLVDDEPNILLSLEFLMRKKGFTVFIARDGEEALEILQAEKPDLILLDIMMPKVDGYEVCEYVKQSDELNHIKIIFLTAKSKEEEVEKGLRAGADLYLTKPFSNKDLMQKIDEQIKERTF